ncbi:hypothetical protein ACJX0J_024601, partial [Zea mays]
FNISFGFTIHLYRGFLGSLYPLLFISFFFTVNFLLWLASVYFLFDTHLHFTSKGKLDTRPSIKHIPTMPSEVMF